MWMCDNDMGADVQASLSNPVVHACVDVNLSDCSASILPVHWITLLVT